MHTSIAATEGLTSSLRGIKRSSYLPNRPTVSQDEDPRGERGTRRLTFFGGVLEDMSISLVVERFRRCAISFTSGVSMVEAGMDPLPTLLRKVSGNNLSAIRQIHATAMERGHKLTVRSKSSIFRLR